MVPSVDRWIKTLTANERDNIAGITVPDGTQVQADELALLKHHPLNQGAKLHVWCDHPGVETETQIAAAIEHALRSLAQKNWGSPALTASYEDFEPLITALGRAPGYHTKTGDIVWNLQ